MANLNNEKRLSLDATVKVSEGGRSTDLLWLYVNSRAHNDLPVCYFDRQGLSELIEYLNGVRAELYEKDLADGRNSQTVS